MPSLLKPNNPLDWISTGLDDTSTAPAPVTTGAFLTGSTAATGTSIPSASPQTRSATPTPSITLAANAVLAGTNQTIGFNSLFNVASSSANPTYLIVSGLDRNEYTTGYNTNGMGHLADGSTTQNFTNYSGDAWSVGVVFTYQPSTGQYTNATYGALSQLSLTTGTNRGDTADISVFGTNNANLASLYARDPITMALNPAYFTNYGTVTVLTGTASTIPAATPNAIVSAANAYVGTAWNDSGCWVLASDIAAKAGASLPLTSTAAGVPGAANGEWFVAYNGPSAANPNWINTLTAGEMVTFVTSSGGGHITTVASGQGTTAQLIDNITYVDYSGNITDGAHDGSPNDVIVQAPHAAMQELSGVNAANVVVYELDTPVVTTTTANLRISTGASVSLSGSFTATNPKPGEAVTQYQVYETNAADTLTIGGAAKSAATSVANACTVNSLSGLGLTASATAGTDTVEVRASNGSYWGDWTALSVTVGGSAPVSVTTALGASGSGPIAITDNAATIAAHADQLQTLAASGRLTAVTISSGGLMQLAASQVANDHSLLSLLPAAPVLQASGATAAQAAGLQSNAQVASFTLFDTAANVTAAHTALATDTKLSYAGITGTSGADTLDLTGVRAMTSIALAGDTARALSGFGAGSLSLTSAPDAITLGSGFNVIGATIQGGGVTTISNFQFGLDMLQLTLGSGVHQATAVNTTYNGAHAVAITGGSATEGVLLINEPATITAATVSSHLYAMGSMALVF